MKLKSLWINEYKNLKDLQLDFEKGKGLSILIGNNGSGKSNVLEAISGIFAEWYGRSSYKFDTDYFLKYDVNDDEFELERNGRYKKVKPYKKDKNFLPSSVIAAYSGENLYLLETFYKPFKRYKKMYYCDKNLWTVSFLVLLLFAYKYTDIAVFLEREFHINKDSIISITFRVNSNYYQIEKDIEVLIDQISDENYPEEFTVSLNELHKRLGYTKRDDDLYYEPKYLFDIFSRACNRVRPAISKIDITINTNIHISDFSEGEKKIILIKSILEFIADQDSLILLDEPDSNVHEGRKIDLYNEIKKYTEFGRQIVMTTHSPIIAKIASEKELIYLESKNNFVSVIDEEKLALIRKLASDEWNIMETGVFLNSEKPLVLFEGKSDIDFVKRAIALLKEDEPKYARIDVDFLSFNGTSNAARFIADLQLLIPTRKLIVLCDNDSAGKNAIRDIKKLKSEYIECSLYPMPTNVTEKQFLLEDYFSKEHINKIIKSIINIRHPYKDLPKLGEGIKRELAANYLTYPKEDYEGFKPLLNKLLELLEIDKNGDYLEVRTTTNQIQSET